jgi:hypothetical protein
MEEDYTDDISQLEDYNKKLQDYINHRRSEFIDLLEEKKRVELILKKHGRE